jgi:hypothetical protein
MPLRFASRYARRASARPALCLLILLALSLPALHTEAQPAPARPFRLPLLGESSPQTWLLQQHFGNTVEAYNYGRYWYADGQRLHFGLDLEALCGTTVHAIGDGFVEWVDNGSFGAGPHNLVINHPDAGYVSVYGHLRDKPPLVRGQPVRAEQAIGVIGDPDLTCASRPHLHLEIRSLDYRTAYNPALLIAADWNLLATLAEPIGIAFQRDLRAPRRWQDLADQPPVMMGNFTLNDYAETWPPSLRSAPAPHTLPPLSAPAAPSTAPVTARRLTVPGCCTAPWWSADSESVRYLDAAPTDERARLFALPLSGGSRRDLGEAPPSLEAPDGRHTVRLLNGRTTLTRTADGRTWPVATRGAWPAFSPRGRQLLWQIRPGDYFPNLPGPRTEIWVAPVAEGGEPRLVRLQEAGSAYWLDEGRLLIVERPANAQRFLLSILRLADDTITPLAEVDFLRRLSVAPGGGHLLYLAPFQSGGDGGLYLLRTQPGARPRLLPFVGGWRWRDSHSLLYIPYQPTPEADKFVAESKAAPMTLRLYDLRTGADRPLNVTLAVANDDWQVSPDGAHVVYRAADDGALWLLTLPTFF